jgi:hypothetical protein
MKRLAVFLSFAFLVPCLLIAQDFIPTETPQQKQVLIHAFDAKGAFLRSGLGFIFDEHTVLTGYETVQGASVIKVKLDDVTARATKVTSWSKAFDLAVLKSEVELPEPVRVASSDTVAAGDSLFYFQREKGTWKLHQAQAKSWIDSGMGYETLQLGLSGPAPSEPSPLLNSAGSIVGWYPGGNKAVPLKAVYSMFLEKSSTIGLSEMISDGKFWSLKPISPRFRESTPIEVHEMNEVKGPQTHPYSLELPALWPHETVVNTQGLLMISLNSDLGILFALRVISAESDDLNMEIERVEMLMFSGMPRAELVPYQSGSLAGLKAIYEDPELHEHSSAVFYAIVGNRLYVLSATYPAKDSAQMDALVSQVFSSFKILK